ncbi:MAG: Co2+/Mg2+ efflux protein ApaG [Rhodoblastus sp.]
MYRALTHDIQVTVLPDYLAEQSEPDAGRYVWSYTIEIANLGALSAQLMTRHWIITDDRGRSEEVKGSGVVGEQPILKPGGAFRYTSGCPLTTPSGIMAGTYRMVDENGRAFDVEIPAFSLDSPFSRKVLH